MQRTHACFDVLSSANTGDEGAGEVLLYVVCTYVGLVGVLANHWCVAFGLELCIAIGLEHGMFKRLV